MCACVRKAPERCTQVVWRKFNKACMHCDFTHTHTHAEAGCKFFASQQKKEASPAVEYVCHRTPFGMEYTGGLIISCREVCV